MPTVHVNANAPAGGYDLGSLGGFTGMGGSGGIAGSPAPSGVHVKNLNPVHVTAQMPVKPSWPDQLWMRQNDLRNDHPYAYHAAKTALGIAVPILPTVMAVANAYERYKHGQPLFGNMFGKLVGSVSGLFSNSPGGPLSSNQENPLYKDLDSSFFNGSGSPSGSTGGSSYYDSQLPNYPGLASMSAYPVALGDMGGYWNQMALHDAAPTYGPFGGYGNKPLPIAPTGISGV